MASGARSRQKEQGEQQEQDLQYWKLEEIQKLPDHLREAVEAVALSLEADGDGQVVVNVLGLSTEHQKELIIEPNVDESIRHRLLDWSVRIFKDKTDWKTRKVKEPFALYNVLQEILNETPGFGFEIQFNNRWYPIHLRIDRYQSFFMGPVCELKASFKIGPNMSHEVRQQITMRCFENDSGNPVERPVVDILAEMDFRPIETDMKDFFRKVRKAQQVSEATGLQHLVTANAVVKVQYDWYHAIESIDFGTPESPRKTVVESDLEIGDQEDGRRRGWYGGDDDDGVILPYVRVFALDYKKYVYVDVEDLLEYEYDSTAIDRLVLPPDMSDIVRTVFTTPCDKLFGDILQNKHGGMVIMAEGGPGVGKTLTAEVFAEHTERPLYVLEVGELGTTPEDVEENLQRVFKRATRWNAVLLFDEADIFMAQRDKNLERNAIVGIFLRLLDYYPGLMFLTTNRADIIDNAFKSRITLLLSYPPLNKESKVAIWKNFFKMSGIVLNDEMGPVEVEDTSVAELPLNGRQIRNMIRLISLVHGDEVSVKQINSLYGYTCKIGNEELQEVFEEEDTLEP